MTDLTQLCEKWSRVLKLVELGLPRVEDTQTLRRVTHREEIKMYSHKDILPSKEEKKV